MTPFEQEVAAVRAGADPAHAAARLLALMAPGKRLSLLDGDEPFWPGMLHMMGVGYNLEPIVAGEVAELGVPGIRFSDGPRGAVIGRSTAFPVPMARGATWDPALEEEVGAAIGAEIRAQGGNLFGGVCINLLRHPAWGRAQETYGEEPVLLGAMGAALTRGVQRHVMACVKHYACNSLENARFRVDVTVDEHALHEVYLPHFRDVVEAGAAAVMSAYNSVNGQWCGQNPVLLTQILREEWGFDGFVMSDFVWGLRDPVASLRAGLDLEMPFAQQRAEALPAALAAGTVTLEDVDRAALRILAAQLRQAALVPEAAPSAAVVASAAHRGLARRVAAQGMVLLRNAEVAGRPVLPLAGAQLSRLAVVGDLADVPNTGDHGSSDVRAPDVVTPLAGLREAMPGAQVMHVAPQGEPLGEAGLTAVAAADAAVVVVGYTAQDEGEYVGSFDPGLAVLYPPPPDPSAPAELALAWEAGPQAVGGDRRSLRLHPGDEELIRAVASVNPRTVVVVLSGSAVTMQAWAGEAPAVLLAWYPGMAGGQALADVLLGRAEPGGRLPFAIPRSESDLPPFDPEAATVTYDRWYGQRLLDRDGRQAAHPLGFGLSYTTWTIGDVRAEVDRDARVLTVRALVTNTGPRPGGHVVQVYATRPGGAGDGAGDGAGEWSGAERFLVGFARAEAAAGQQVAVGVEVPLRRLAVRQGPGRWNVPAGPYRIEVGASAADPAGTSLVVTLP
jgi:beta-glucosidase